MNNKSISSYDAPCLVAKKNITFGPADLVVVMLRKFDLFDFCKYFQCYPMVFFFKDVSITP